MTPSVLVCQIEDLSEADLTSLKATIAGSAGKLEGDANVAYSGSLSDFTGLTGTAEIRTTAGFTADKKNAFDDFVDTID